MAGQMGRSKTTVQGVEIVRVDSERNLILLKGGLPGAPGGDDQAVCVYAGSARPSR